MFVFYLYYKIFYIYKKKCYVCAVLFLVTQSVCLFVTPWTIAHKAPLSIGFSRQEYWSGLLYPPPGDLPNLGIEPTSPVWRNLHCRQILYLLSHWGSTV